MGALLRVSLFWDRNLDRQQGPGETERFWTFSTDSLAEVHRPRRLSIKK
jgi:hypothetical protein